MKTLKYTSWLASLCITLSVAQAATVNEAEVIDFQAGQPACAADVNQTIQALIDAVNDNNAQITQLKEQLFFAQAGISLSPTSLENQLKGSVFQVGVLEVGLGTSSDRNGLTEIGVMRNYLYGESGALTLNGDGTLTFEANFRERESDVDVNSGFDQFDPSNPFPLIIDVNTTTSIDDSGSETIPGTWSVNGQSLVLDIDGDIETFHLNTDGSTFMSQGNDVDSGSNVPTLFADLLIGIRTYKPVPDIKIVVSEDPSPAASAPPVEVQPNGEHRIFYQSSHYGDNGRNITIENTGDQDLVIHSWSIINQPAENFYSIENPNSLGAPLTIVPGDSTQIPVYNHAPIDQIGGTTYLDPATIGIISNDPDTPAFSFSVSARVN